MEIINEEQIMNGHLFPVIRFKIAMDPLIVHLLGLDLQFFFCFRMNEWMLPKWKKAI
jgi:hypothetical protein